MELDGAVLRIWKTLDPKPTKAKLPELFEVYTKYVKGSEALLQDRTSGVSENVFLHLFNTALLICRKSSRQGYWNLRVLIRMNSGVKAAIVGRLSFSVSARGKRFEFGCMKSADAQEWVDRINLTAKQDPRREYENAKSDTVADGGLLEGLKAGLSLGDFEDPYAPKQKKQKERKVSKTPPVVVPKEVDGEEESQEEEEESDDDSERRKRRKSKEEKKKKKKDKKEKKERKKKKQENADDEEEEEEEEDEDEEDDPFAKLADRTDNNSNGIGASGIDVNNNSGDLLDFGNDFLSTPPPPSAQQQQQQKQQQEQEQPKSDDWLSQLYAQPSAQPSPNPIQQPGVMFVPNQQAQQMYQQNQIANPPFFVPQPQQHPQQPLPPQQQSNDVFSFL